MVAIDASMLILFLNNQADGPRDEHGKPIPYARKRVEYLIARLDRSGTKVAIPTPALSEVLVRRGPTEAQKIVEILNRKAVFSIESFDQLAAIELALMLKSEMGRKRVKDGPDTWAKLKFDRQIVAITKVRGIDTIYSDDGGIKTVGERAGITVTATADLPLPPSHAQTDLTDEMGAGKPTGEDEPVS